MYSLLGSQAMAVALHHLTGGIDPSRPGPPPSSLAQSIPQPPSGAAGVSGVPPHRPAPQTPGIVPPPGQAPPSSLTSQPPGGSVGVAQAAAAEMLSRHRNQRRYKYSFYCLLYIYYILPYIYYFDHISSNSFHISANSSHISAIIQLVLLYYSTYQYLLTP